MDIKEVEFLKLHVLTRISNEMVGTEFVSSQVIEGIHDDVEEIFDLYMKIYKIKNHQILDKIPF